MRNIWLVLPLWGGLLLGMGACSPIAVNEVESVETAVPTPSELPATPTPPEPTAAAVPTSCQIENGHLFMSEAGDYCFSYPENYCWFPGNVPTIHSFVNIPAADSETNRCPDEPMLFHGDVIWVRVAVEPANGQLLSDVEESFEPVIEKFDLDVEHLTFAGETAVQINNMPGQEISRELITIHNDRLYRLTFVPAGINDGSQPAPREGLYAHVIGSFQFLPAE